MDLLASYPSNILDFSARIFLSSCYARVISLRVVLLAFEIYAVPVGTELFENINLGIGLQTMFDK